MSNQQNLAFVFPGQGSQKVGMLAEFADHQVVRDTFAQASEALGYDVWERVQDGSQEALNQTEVTQPVLLTCSVALWRVWEAECDRLPVLLAGHSLGEWSALVCGGVVAFEDAVKLVRSRGKYMQEAVPAGEGAMAAIIGLDDDKVEVICRDLSSGSEVVAPVNYNSPGQLVIAGTTAAVNKAIEACSEAGAKRALSLPVSAPFHTSLMKPAADRLAAEIEATTFAAPVIPVVHNVTAATESDPEKIKRLMVEQIYSPVQWVDCVQHLVEAGISSAVECGPGKVLSGLIKRIDRSVASSSTDSLAAIAKAKDSVNNSQ